MYIAFQVKAAENGRYTCAVVRKDPTGASPQDIAAADLAEGIFCIVLECLEIDEKGEPFFFEQKFARLLGERLGP